MSVQSTEEVVCAQGLVKRYEEFPAVKEVDFTVYSGECIGLLGPNGAGKSSIVKMVYGFSPVTAGKLSVLGKDIMQEARTVKREIGVVAQDDNLDPDLTVFENLLVYAGYFLMPQAEARDRAKDIIKFMELTDKANEIVENLSGGQKRRLTIGRALLNKPKLLILDEPTTGLDPYARHVVWQRLRKLKEAGTTMLLTTHYLEEASQLCDRLLVIHRGELLEEGTPLELIEKYVGKEALELGVKSDYHAAIIEQNNALIKSHQVLGDDLILYTNQAQPLVQAISKQIPFEGDTHQRLRPTNLEDVFLKLTGETLESDGKSTGGDSSWQD